MVYSPLLIAANIHIEAADALGSRVVDQRATEQSAIRGRNLDAAMEWITGRLPVLGDGPGILPFDKRGGRDLVIGVDAADIDGKVVTSRVSIGKDHGGGSFSWLVEPLISCLVEFE